MNSPTIFYGFWKEGVLAAAMEIKSTKGATHIQSLTVVPDYFRQGIGYKLLDFAIQAHPSALITVETGLGNTPAIRFYENFGFVKQKIWMTEVGIEKIAFTIKNNKL
jgi:ribosomal protein S18 acetylase RimI-like enzyme